MKVTVIGGSGHVGTYLVPRLWEAGHESAAVSRGQREPYLPHAAWKRVEHVILNREPAEREGTFARRIAEMRRDVVIDLISFRPDSSRMLVDALRGRVRHFLHCGTIWVKGWLVVAPTTEDTPSEPFGDYGVSKEAIEDCLLDEARRGTARPRPSTRATSSAPATSP